MNIIHSLLRQGGPLSFGHIGAERKETVFSYTSGFQLFSRGLERLEAEW